MRNNQKRLGRGGRAKATSPAPAASQSTLAFTIPTEFVELPSRGALYSEGHPLYGQDTIEIKFMTAKHEDILSSQALIKKGLAVDRFLENIIVPDVDPTTLLVGDRSAILIAARISGYGSKYDVNVSCEHCGEPAEIEYDLKSASLVEGCFDDEFLSQNNIEFNEDTKTFDLTLPKSGVVIGVALLSGEREKEYISTITEDDENPITNILSALITKVNDSYDEKYINDFIEAMPAFDSKHVRNIYPKLVPNIQLVHEWMCSGCMGDNTTEVPLSAEFFWPK